jgi:Tol biopolymer transport system component
MQDPNGKRIFFINGKDSGFLSVYDLRSKSTTDIIPELATQPTISPNGKRVMYITQPEPHRSELWVSDIDGNNRTKLASSASLATGAWSPDGSQLEYVDAGADVDRHYVVNSDANCRVL